MVVLRNRIDDRGGSKNLDRKLKPNIDLQHFVDAQLQARTASEQMPTPAADTAVAIACVSEEIVNSLIDQWRQLYHASDSGDVPALLPCSASSIPMVVRAQINGCSATLSRNVRYILHNRLTVRLYVFHLVVTHYRDSSALISVKLTQ